METRDRVAFALFAFIYEGSLADDPTFPSRVWATMDAQKRRLWYRQADVALAAAAAP